MQVANQAANALANLSIIDDPNIRSEVANPQTLAAVAAVLANGTLQSRSHAIDIIAGHYSLTIHSLSTHYSQVYVVQSMWLQWEAL